MENRRIRHLHSKLYSGAKERQNMALDNSGQWAEALPRLAQEADLQKMLADEKMRSEAHKTNYQTLKIEHTRLQDEYVQVQSEMKATIEETKLVQEKYKTLLDQAKKDKQAKQAECEALREQNMNPQKLDMLRMQVLEDVEKHFRHKLEELSGDCDQYRTDYNKLKYEYSFLKAEYEHEKAETARIAEEMRLRHEAELNKLNAATKRIHKTLTEPWEQIHQTWKEQIKEEKVTNLRKERANTLERLQGDSNADTQRLRAVQRENAQLQLKIKGLLSELEETRAQNEHLGVQNESVARLQSKQLTENAANIKALETEKQTLKSQCESLQKEITQNTDLQTQLSGRIHELEKDNLVLKNRAEEAMHRGRVDQTNLKMEMLRERGELERQRDMASNTVEDLRSQIEVLKLAVEKEEEAVVDKERESVRRVQAAREEEWAKIHSLETSKMELESKLQEWERRKIDEEARTHAEREKAEDRLTAAKEAKDSAEKEVLVLRTKISHHESLLHQLERERSENSDLKTRLHRVESTYQSHKSNEQELTDTNMRLKREVEVLREDMRSAKEEMGRSKMEHEKQMALQQTGLVEEKLNMRHRVEELEQQAGEAQRRQQQMTEANKKKKKKISQIVSKLKNKLQVYSAKIEELKIERDTLRKYVSPEQHVTLKKKMNDLIRRHREFRTIILSENYSPADCKNCKTKVVDEKQQALLHKLKGAMKEVPIGDFSFASAEYNMQNATFLDLANHHEKELMSIKERLDTLDTHQHKQFEELKDVSPLATPRKHVYDSGSSHHDLFSEDGLDTEPERDPNSGL